ncbi:MAG TPA: Flp pilus assembly protein CpaB [Candidatus Hypogeohydataceae bacterium YC41]
MKRLLLPLILFGIAVIIGVTTFILLVYGKKPRAGEVLVAKSDIQAGSVIEQGHIWTIPWVGRTFPEGFIDSKNKNKVINRVAAVDIVQGAPICEKCLAAPGTAIGLFAKIPKGQRALTVKVDEVSGVAGFSRPGARADILLAGTETAEGGKKGEQSAKIILQNVLVLAAGQRVTQLEGKEKPQVVNTVTLLVSPEEAERLALATKMGTLLLTLRPGGDGDTIRTNGSFPADVWGIVTNKESPRAIIELIQGGVKTRVRLEEENEEQEKKQEEKIEGGEKTAEAGSSAVARRF